MYKPVHNPYLFLGAQPMWFLINTGRGYHLWSSEYENKPLPDLPIWYSPLSPSCHAWSHVVLHSESESHKPHKTYIDGNVPIMNDF
jgi:hypothetical protein